MSGQRGAALLLLLALVLTGTAAFLVASGTGERRLLTRVDQDAAALARARDLIMGHALANPRRPGELPFPDRRADGNYDGNGDCVSTWTDVMPAHLLGQLPAFLEQGCGPDRPAFGVALHDGSGERLWYAVSRHLLYPAPVLNSAVAGEWLEVHSVHGVMHAAFVVFAPGPAMGMQQRNPGAAADAYLDGIELDGVFHHNGDDDARFVIAPARHDFNDRLLIVSAGQYLDTLTLHIARTLRIALENHRAAHGAYPHAAFAGGACRQGLADGLFPVSLGDCAAIPLTPPWFASDWAGITRYTRLNASLVRLSFAGCAREFIVTPQGVSPSTGSCT